MNAFREFFMGRGQSGGTETMETATSNGESERRGEERVTGKIIKVSDEGWGFIISADIKFERIFFHWTSLVHDTLKFPDLKRGMHVDFVPVDKGERGYHAIKVRVTEGSKEN